MKKQVLIVVCLLAAFSFSAWAGLNDGLIAYYPFNGNANDASGNGNNATVYGATLTADRFGNANAAYDFDGSSSYIDIPQNTVLDNLTANFTLSAWIYQRTTNINYGYRIIDKCPAGVPGGWTFDTWDGSTYRRLRLQAAGVNNPNVLGATVYSLMQWHHVVATVSGTTGKVYLDGNLDGTGNVGSIPQNLLDIFIGRSHPYGADPGNREYFNGIIDDVRIYNRALSDSEVQQLYSQSNIGLAPTNPVVVQTNRAPTSTEIGSQTSGSFKVFTNGFFQTNIPLNTNLMTIVLTHGWNSSSDDWPSNMASQFVAAGISANIVAWDWRNDAKSDATPWSCAGVLMKTPAQGYALGTNLLQTLGGGYNQPIHFIGHSFGTEVNAAAANYLQANGIASVNIQMTLFDEAEIANDLRIVSPTTWNNLWYISPLPTNFAWADNYVSLVGELQNNAKTVNVILTEDQPAGFYTSTNDLWNALINYHAVPCQWYGQTILNPSGGVMGDIWSFEQNSTFTSPAGGTYFEQQDNGLSVSQITPVAADLWQQSEAGAFHRDLALFATLKVVDASVPVVGDVAANVVDTVLNDSTPTYVTTPATIGISSYAPATPDYWSPQLILQSQPLNFQPNLKSFGVRPLDNPPSTSSNSPAYAWLPMTIPTNAAWLSFDFMIQSNGASDSFAAAVNGTNIFSLPLNLIQTNVVLNSGMIDVSAYAGTNIELFLGIVGGTSTNASVAVSGVRLYETISPSLQAQATGGNLILSWPMSAQNFSLQTTTNLADPNSWTTLTNVPAIVNLQNAVTNSISDGMRFYRLKQ